MNVISDNRISTASATRADTSALSSYSVQRGDTLSALAARFGTDGATLARINGIANPDRIYPGQQLAVPGESGRVHVVSRGETLGAIARGAGLSLAEVMRANPQIRNADVIYPGDQINLPALGAAPGAERVNPGPATQGAAPVGETRLAGGTLSLSQADINNIKKTLQTEWVQSAGDAQAHGIIDTILNRTASGRWGTTVADVVNARNQFSDINGPVSRRDGRNSVDDIPMSRVSARVDRLVDSYLAERAAGRASSIGSHLNYANPNYSDARNLGWINALEGPVLGRGDAIHRHGTTPDLERFRPGAFAIALPGTQPAPSPTARVPDAATGAFDGRVLAAQVGVAVKNGQVDLDSLHPAMDPVIRAVTVAAQRLGLPQPVITSGNDSRHSSGSLHYENRCSGSCACAGGWPDTRFGL
jgi:LysM repeat protein